MQTFPKFTPILLLIASSALQTSCVTAPKATPAEVAQYDTPVQDSPLLQQYVKQTGFSQISKDPAQYRLQIALTTMARNCTGQPKLVTHVYRPDAEYLYPASTVKLLLSALALEYINELKPYGVSRDSTMVTEPLLTDDTRIEQDLSAADGRPTVAHYIKKILLVSDNEAYNRLYELLGQQRINRRLTELGFGHSEILHRLERSLSAEDNRKTNAVRFYSPQGNLLFQQAAKQAPARPARALTPVGQAHYRAGQLVNEPLDFSGKNRWRLTDMHQLTQYIMWPESQPQAATARLQISKDDLVFLQAQMAQTPPESTDPSYAADPYHQHYVKFLYYGADAKMPKTAGLRIHNKVGDAYGFLLDSAYFHADNGALPPTEFVLSAALYVNADGVLNDDQYEYETLGLPFLAKLGQLVLADQQQKSQQSALKHATQCQHNMP